MISDWLKLRTSTAELDEAVTEAMGLVAAFISSKHGCRMTLELRREIRVYVTSCIRNDNALYERADRSPMPTPALIKAKLSFAGYYCDEFNFETAKAHYDACVFWLERFFGPRDPCTIRALTLQADFYTNYRDPATAAKLHKRLLRLEDKRTSVQLAKCYEKQGKHKKAQTEYRKALAQMEEDLPPNDPRIVGCKLQMALNETQLSSGDAAEPLEEALRLLDERLLNDPGQDAGFDETEATIRLEVLNHLGNIYHDEREDFVKSEIVWGRALDVAEQLYGAENGKTLRFAHNLAVAYNQLDKLAESESMYQRTLDGYEAFYGPESELAVKVCHCYGHVLGSRYKVLEAINLHIRAVDGIQKIYGVESDFAMSLFDCLVCSYLDLGDKLELEKLYKRAVEQRTEVLGADHEKTVDMRFALGKLYVEERRLNEAELFLRQSVDGYYHLFGSKEDDVRTWQAMEALYKVFIDLDRLGEAAGLCEDLLSARSQQRVGDIHNLDVAHDLSEIFHRLGKEDEIDAIHQVFDEAFNTVLEKTERGETDIAESLAALSVRTGNEPHGCVNDETAPTSTASNVHSQSRKNPCLHEEDNMYRLTTGPRLRSERSVADVSDPDKTKLIVGYPFMDFKPEMPYTNSLY